MTRTPFAEDTDACQVAESFGFSVYRRQFIEILDEQVLAESGRW